jgi:hypothetical protein
MSASAGKGDMAPTGWLSANDPKADLCRVITGSNETSRERSLTVRYPPDNGTKDMPGGPGDPYSRSTARDDSSANLVRSPSGGFGFPPGLPQKFQ